MNHAIRIERAILDITQDGLAKRENVSRQTINTIEAGKYVEFFSTCEFVDN